MKLKSTLAAALLISSFASQAVSLTLSPVETAYNILATALSPIDITAGSALISTEASSAYKEAINAVKADALNFLAGEEATDSLKVIFEELAQYDELEGLSEEELAIVIIDTPAI